MFFGVCAQQLISEPLNGQGRTDEGSSDNTTVPTITELTLARYSATSGEALWVQPVSGNNNLRWDVYKDGNRVAESLPGGSYAPINPEETGGSVVLGVCTVDIVTGQYSLPFVVASNFGSTGNVQGGLSSWGVLYGTESPPANGQGRTNAGSNESSAPLVQDMTVSRYENQNIEVFWTQPISNNTALRWDVYLNGTRVSTENNGGSYFIADAASENDSIEIAVCTVNTANQTYSRPFIASGIMTQGSALVGELDFWANVYN